MAAWHDLYTQAGCCESRHGTQAILRSQSPIDASYSGSRVSRNSGASHGEFRGKPVNIKNVNYYALVKDRWIDVHVSVSNPSPQDDVVLAALDKKLEFKVLAEK